MAEANEGVLRLMSFEQDEVDAICKTLKAKASTSKLADERQATSVSIPVMMRWSIVEGDASDGDHALVLRSTRLNIFRKFKVPPEAIEFYGIDQDQWSPCFRTAGVFRRLFPIDWSKFDVLRFDVSARDVPLTVRITLEDEEIAPPVVRNFQVKPGAWRTCEVDLRKAARERGFDLTRMATLNIAVVNMDGTVPRDAPYPARLDHLRLVSRNHPAKYEVVRDDSPHELPPLFQPSKGPKPERLLDGKPDRSPLTLGPPITIVTGSEKPVEVNMTGWIAAYDNKQLLVGFSAGGTGSARTAMLQTIDGGKTWTGLDGKRNPTWFSTPYPDHQATPGRSIGQRSDVMLFTNLGCNGQRMAGLRLFSRHCEFTGKGWKLREQPALVDCDLRHCNSNLSAIRTEDGRIWAAYGLVGRLGTQCINVRFSDDGGRTWKASRPGTSGVIPETVHSEKDGVSFGRYTFDEPSMVLFGEGVACFWQSGRGPLKWTRFDGKTWSPIEEIDQPKGTAYNPTRPGATAVHLNRREIFLVSARFDGVYHWSDGKWKLEAPDVPAGSRISVAGGKTVVIMSTGIRESRDYRNHKGPVTFSMWQRKPGGTWQGPTKLLTEEHPLTRNDNPYLFRPAYIVQRYAPPNFVPLAWTCDKQKWIKLLKVPVTP